MRQLVFLQPMTAIERAWRTGSLPEGREHDLRRSLLVPKATSGSGISDGNPEEAKIRFKLEMFSMRISSIVKAKVN